MWSHSKTKPYKCTYENCKKSFLQSSALKVHIRTHTGEKPFVCGVEGCVRAFSDSSSCSRHRRHHLKLKPYQCTFKGCVKSFTRNETLQKHYESQHSEDNTENGVMSESGNEEMRSEASPMSFVSESPQIEITEYPYDLSGTNVTNTDYFDSTGMMSPYFNTEEFGMMGVDANGNGIPGMGSSALSPMVSSSLTMPPMGMDGCNLVSPMVEESPMDFGFENFVRVFPVYVGDDGVHYVGVEGDKYFVEKKLLGDGAN
ncbi:hypothetical protein HK098_007751 [Nowakowskiella sp. JEL0407]|nr:hypothetical protein HK098_007751 [Nowakowskiella sp. JEL0407]